MWDFLTHLFDTSGFPPRWYCGSGWTAGNGWLGWLHILSDLGVWSAYVAIPCVLLYFAWRRRDLPFRLIFLLFGAFIMACGTTHLMEAVIFWWPAYRLAGLIKLGTALVSWGTVVALVQVAPRALTLRTPEALQLEIDERRKAEANLMRLQAGLESRVAERTSELAQANASLKAEIAERQRSEEALQQSEARLRLFLENTLEAFISIDSSGHIAGWNRQSEIVFGWNRDEALGRNLAETVIPPQHRTAHTDGLARFLAGGEGPILNRRIEISALHRDGHEFPIELAVTPAPCNGQVFFDALVRDITEQRKAAEVFSELAAIVESSDDAIIGKTLDGIITSWNPAAQRLYGYTADEMIGNSIAVLMPPEHPHELADILERLRRGERPEHTERERLRKDGTRLQVSVSISPIKAADGRIIGAASIARDMSERKLAEQALRESEDRARSVVDHVVDGIITIDAQGKVASCNPAAEWLFGYAAAEVVGQNVKMLMPQPYHAEHDGYLANYLNTGHAKIIGIGREVIGRRKDGATFPMYLAVSEFRLGDRRFFTGIVRDITERKRAQESLEIQTRELAEANAFLSRSNRDLDEFAYVAAHDLREPLRGIHNYATFLLEDYADKLDADGQLKLETLRRLSKRMDSLIDALLQFSRVGRTELAVQPTNLQGVLEEVLDSLRITLEERGVEIRIPTPLPEVVCDRVRIGEVFENLIVNAVKYNDKPQPWIEIGTVTRAAEAVPRAMETATNAGRRPGPSPPVFYVRDNGIGIPENHHESVFRIFKRLHGRDKFGGGTGAGLTIVKKIVERHGGRIWIESFPDEGATFYFTLAQEPAL